MGYHSRLSNHKFNKGVFVTPFNSIPNVKELEDEKSWTYGRMPEYLWIGLILKKFGRNDGFQKLSKIISLLHEIAPELYTARMSQILKLPDEKQREFYHYIVVIGAKEALAPLTILLTASTAPLFAESFYCAAQSVQDRCNTLIETMRDLMDHQSHESTDVRFVALYFNQLSGRVHLLKEQIEVLSIYPLTPHAEEIMKLARPTVRCAEMMILTFEEADSTYLQKFWEYLSEMTQCSIYSFVFPEENRNVSEYMENLHTVFKYLSELYVAANPIDEKMCVLLGLATYSYKRLKEVYCNNLFNSITGRTCVRVLVEDFIMMKYLSKNEALHDNIWRDYQLYGMGLYKLILARYRELDHSDDSHFDGRFIQELVNEFKDEEFINMDTRYFDNQNIRVKAESVGEKSLYGLYYDYDSSFEHGLWGAIRESALLKCNNPAHKYHCIPDIEDKNRLKSVLPDCIMVMNKTICFLDEVYGIPEHLINGVLNFEIRSIGDEN